MNKLTELTNAMNDGLDILNKYLGDDISIPSGSFAAVVFDIDDTLIDSKTHKRIEPMYMLYNSIVHLGIPVFLISARPMSIGSRIYTEGELLSLGITGYTDIYLVGGDEKVLTSAGWVSVDRGDKKAAVRRKLMMEDRYFILMNIGDDPKDFKHGYAEYEIQLP